MAHTLRWALIGATTIAREWMVNAIRQNECELFAQYAKQLGVTVNVEPTDSLGKTTSSGDYDIIVFAWVQSPFPYGGAQQLWLSNSGSNYGKYQNPKTDQLINAAANSTDKASAAQQLNDADKTILGDAYVLPLYQKPTFLAIDNNLVNIRDNATSVGPPYNVQEWGVKSS